MATKILDFIHKHPNQKVLKSFFDYLDRFFRNLAKTDKNYAFGYHSHIAIFLVASSWRLVYYWENSDFGVRRSNTLGSYQQEVFDWIFWFHIRISFCFSVRISNGKTFWKKLPKDYLMFADYKIHVTFLIFKSGPNSQIYVGSVEMQI